MSEMAFAVLFIDEEPHNYGNPVYSGRKSWETHARSPRDAAIKVFNSTVHGRRVRVSDWATGRPLKVFDRETILTEPEENDSSNP